MLTGKRGSVKKTVFLIKRSDNKEEKTIKKEAKTIWKWDHRAKSNYRKKKEKKVKAKSADYLVKTKNSGSQVER